MSKRNANTFKIDFCTANSAFDGGSAPFEIARILEGIAEQIKAGEWSGNIWDSNGNTVGKFTSFDNNGNPFNAI